MKPDDPLTMVFLFAISKFIELHEQIRLFFAQLRLFSLMVKLAQKLATHTLSKAPSLLTY